MIKTSMFKKKVKSGIQSKYLRYTISLLLLALLLSSAGVWFYMKANLTRTVTDKYDYMNEKMGIALDNLFQKTDKVTADCIINEHVQKSLESEPMEEVDRNSLSKYFAYIDLESVSKYCYVDNKKNIYTRSYSQITYKDFKESGFSQKLGKSYAKTQWFWAKDTLFGTGEKALFIGRYVHSLEYSHEPGMLFLKMNERFLKDVIESNTTEMENVAVCILDKDGNIGLSNYPEGFRLSSEDRARLKNAATAKNGGTVIRSQELKDGVFSAYRQKGSGLTVCTIIPDKVLVQGVGKIFLVLAGLYLVVIIVAIVLSLYFAKRFTKPIRELSVAMSGFNGQDFRNTLSLHTHTELDQIGQAYNLMLTNIEELLKEVKNQQRELRRSELNALISQINPHFLYNTLDTIYMLARMNGEQNIMKMIQALSEYLRISLNKGHEMVTVEDELKNVKSYMLIQQIRNENLFHYEIDCQVEEKQTWVLKLLLQPLVENAIKHGFDEIYEGGIIRITVSSNEEYLYLSVYNSGQPISESMKERLNALNARTLAEIRDCFPQKEHGYGVVNVLTRLRLKYGEEVRLLYEAEENGTKCTVRIPKQYT